MMHRTGDCDYFEDGVLQVLRLPYAGRELSMVILLPRRMDGLAELEKSVSAGGLASWMRGTASRKVDVTLPRFTATGRISLRGPLEKLGMAAAFSREADFSGITGGKDLAISKVIHKAFVSVDEEGTEAAAATGIGMMTLSVRVPEPPAVFRADHPFLFVIVDEKTGAILFMGRLASRVQTQ